LIRRHYLEKRARAKSLAAEAQSVANEVHFA
jgi:hypothetical protein